jgi:hypothetical protein
MTEIDDLELSQRLRALRVEPPANGFEARFAERLLELQTEGDAPAEPRRAPARGIVGPWLRRGPVRLIGATALLVAGAAAALEGGVVEWVQTRVFTAPSGADTPASPPPPTRGARAERRVGTPVERPPAAPPLAPEPARARPADAVPAPAAASAAPGTAERSSAVPRVQPERRALRLPEVPLTPERRPSRELPSVPRVEIEPRPGTRIDGPEGRLGRAASPGPSGGMIRERGRDLERIREIARARRELPAAAERPRGLERIRERRERAAAERRENQAERARRERPIR